MFIMEATNEGTCVSGDAAELARKVNDYVGQDGVYMDIGGKMTQQQSQMENLLSYEEGGSVPDYGDETLGQGQEGHMFRQYDSIQFTES